MITNILLGILILVLCNLSRKVHSMTKASDRLAASLGDLESTASDVVAALAAIPSTSADDAVFNQAADRVDAITKTLNDALAQPAA